MSYEDFDHLIYDYIGIWNLEYHDFKFVWRIYDSKDKADFIDYQKFYRDIQTHLVSSDGIREGTRQPLGATQGGRTLNKSRSPSGAMRKT